MNEGDIPVNEACVSRVIPGTTSQIGAALCTLAAREWGAASRWGYLALRPDNRVDATCSVSVAVDVKVGRRTMPTELEVTGWSAAAAQILLRPALSKRFVTAPALTDRYFDVAHAAMSDLAFDIERLLFVPAPAGELT